MYDSRCVYGKNSLFVNNIPSMNDKHPIKGVVYNDFPCWIDPGRPITNDPVLLLNVTAMRSSKDSNQETKKCLKGPFRAENFKIKEIGIWAANSNTKRLDWSKFDRHPNLQDLSRELNISTESSAEEVFNNWRDRVEKRSNREKNILMADEALRKALEEEKYLKVFS